MEENREYRHSEGFEQITREIVQYLQTIEGEEGMVKDFYVLTFLIPTDSTVGHLDPLHEKFWLLDEEEVREYKTEDIPFTVQIHYKDAVWLTGDESYRASDACDQIQWILDDQAHWHFMRMVRDNCFSYRNAGFENNRTFSCSCEGVTPWGKYLSKETAATEFVENMINDKVYRYVEGTRIFKPGFAYFYKMRWQKAWVGFCIFFVVLSGISVLFRYGIVAMLSNLAYFIGTLLGGFVCGLFICAVWCLIYATVRAIFTGIKRSVAKRN